VGGTSRQLKSGASRRITDFPRDLGHARIIAGSIDL
jgi:hypothetical protein